MNKYFWSFKVTGSCDDCVIELLQRTYDKGAADLTTLYAQLGWLISKIASLGEWKISSFGSIVQLEKGGCLVNLEQKMRIE